MPKHDKTDRAFHYFQDALAQGSTFRKQDISTATGWDPATVDAYMTKKWRHILIEDQGNTFRVRKAFRLYTSARFRKLQSQVTSSPSDYIRRSHETVINFEFLLPLTRQTH